MLPCKKKVSNKSGHGNDFGFKTKSRHSDLTLKVGGVKLYVNKVVLEMASPCLQGIFDEKLKDVEQQEITLDDEDVVGFIEFLACIYPGCLHEVKMTNVFRILPLACKYNVNCLKEKSVTLLTGSLTEKQPEEHIYRCLSAAEQHSITTVESKCMELLVDIYKADIQRADEILTLKEEVKPVVMSAMIPLLRSEASKYRFLSAGPRCRDNHVDLNGFHDAKYATVQFQVNYSDLVNAFKLEKTVSSVPIWDVSLNIKMRGSWTFSFRIAGYIYLIAAKMAMKNNIPGKDDIWKQNSGDTELSTTFNHLDAGAEGIQWHDKVTILVHVLVNKPSEKGVNVRGQNHLSLQQRNRTLEEQIRRDGDLERHHLSFQQKNRILERPRQTNRSLERQLQKKQPRDGSLERHQQSNRSLERQRHRGGSLERLFPLKHMPYI